MGTFEIIFLSLIPAGIVAITVYYVVDAFLERDQKRRLIKFKSQSLEVTLPLQLQAYERLCLYLERIAPNQLVLRLNGEGLNAVQLQHMMVTDIREEYNHNATQQVYVSDEAWQAVIHAKEEMIALINNIAETLEQDAPALELAKHLFQAILSAGDDVVTNKLKVVKGEAQKLMII